MLHISDNHPIFGLQKSTQAVTQEFLNSLNLSYFQYLRCFDDGSIGLLVNDTSLLGYLRQAENEPVVFSSFQETDTKLPAYWFLWDEMLPEKPVSFARKCHFHQGITWVRRSKKYYDMIAVALAKPLDNPGSFYLNYQNRIEQFIEFFDFNNRKLLTQMNQGILALPEPYRDQNYDKIPLIKGRLSFMGNHEETYLTAQELACLQALSKGASYKEIAQHLNLSPRSVETYFNRIKNRTAMTLDAVQLRLVCP